MSTWFKWLCRPGFEVRGKWHGHRYRVVDSLGEGVNGAVFLVEALENRRLCALKIGFDSLLIQSEMNTLVKLGLDRVEPRYVLDMDDVTLAGESHAFYVMARVEGLPMREFLKRHSAAWLPVIGTRLLLQLQEIHSKGYVFGDLKSEHVMVARHGAVQLLDYGGVTPFGHAVRQFTPHYDRGYWRAGHRTADERYDLFSFAVLCIESVLPEKFSECSRQQADKRTVQSLLQLLHQESSFQLVRPTLQACLLGDFLTSEEARRNWMQVNRAIAVMPSRPIHGGLLKIIFACSILLFICSILFLMPN